MSKINVILEGRYKGRSICINKNFIEICGRDVTKKDIVSYEIIDESNKNKYSLWKGALGVALLGGFGAVAGIGGKNKKEYLIAIEWHHNTLMNDDKSLICLDERYYKTFIRSMF